MRYAYFMVPLLCIGLGIVLAWLMRRGRAGAVLALAVLVLVCLGGLDVLLGGVFLDIKPTLTALTH